MDSRSIATRYPFRLLCAYSAPNFKIETEEELKRRTSNTEDGWTERKPQSVGKDDVRKTLIGFANSVPEGDGSASSVRPWTERSGLLANDVRPDPRI